MAISGTEPAKIAEEVMFRVWFAKTPEVDEFTLERYRFSLEKMKSDNPAGFDEKDYVALGHLYYNKGNFEKFKEILNEGIARLNSLLILNSLILGRIASVLHRDLEKNQIFEAIRDWFNHPLNE